jgi:hypothetical protein
VLHLIEVARNQGHTASEARLRGGLGVRLLQADLNVSLTAISQLWNAADFLARLPTLDSDAPTGTPGVVPPAAMMASSGPPSTGSLRAAGVDSSKYAELLEVLFGALQVR